MVITDNFSSQVIVCPQDFSTTEASKAFLHYSF